MKLFLHILFSPISYLKIKDEEASQKVWFDFLLPGILAVCFSFTLLFLDETISINLSVLFSKFSGVINILPGFYIASIAAVATFDKADLNTDIKSMKLELFYPKKGIEETPINKRIFLCSMFSYLTFLSVICSLSIVFVPVFVKILASSFYYEVFKEIGVFMLLLMLSQLATVTCWALYYMAHRIHITG